MFRIAVYLVKEIHRYITKPAHSMFLMIGEITTFYPVSSVRGNNRRFLETNTITGGRILETDEPNEISFCGHSEYFMHWDGCKIYFIVKF